MKITSTSCDGCGADLSRDTSLHQFCLGLRTEYIQSPKNVDDFKEPPLDREFHFCDEKCLGQWCAKRSAG